MVGSKGSFPPFDGMTHGLLIPPCALLMKPLFSPGREQRPEKEERFCVGSVGQEQGCQLERLVAKKMPNLACFKCACTLHSSFYHFESKQANWHFFSSNLAYCSLELMLATLAKKSEDFSQIRLGLGRTELRLECLGILKADSLLLLHSLPLKKELFLPSIERR